MLESFISPKFLINILSETINQSVPTHILILYIYLAMADWITGVITAIQLRRFVSNVGITGILRKINVIIGYIAFCVVMYSMTKEHITSVILGYIIVLYEMNSIFENIARADKRIGAIFKQAQQKILERFISHHWHKEQDKKKDE